MKFNRIIALALGALLASGINADAQVSVRRGNKNTGSTEQSRPRDTKPKNTPSLPGGREVSAPQTPASPSKPASPAKPTSPARPEPAAPGTAPRKNTGAPRRQQPAAVPGGKTLRQQAFDEYQKDAATEAPWQHVVYRELDLKEEANASLYFPVEPMDGMTNLFRVILDAFVKGELKTYEYLDGREVFTEKYLVKPQDILDKFEIYYQVKPASQRGGADVYEISESDVPCEEVLSYYIKERWEFDQKHSRYQARILSVCPVLHRAADYGGDAARYPLFWINFEDLRPFLRDHLVVSQGMNTAARYTMEEFFTLGQYDGTIYKEQNLRGLSLMQQFPEADSLKAEQKRLDDKLRSFGDTIWNEGMTVEEEPADVKTRPAKAADERKAGKVTEKKNRRTKQDVDVEAAETARDEKATSHKSVRRSKS